MTGKELIEFIINNDFQESNVLIHSTYGIHDLSEEIFEIYNNKVYINVY